MNMEDYFDMLQKAVARNAREKAKTQNGAHDEDEHVDSDGQAKRY